VGKIVIRPKNEIKIKPENKVTLTEVEKLCLAEFNKYQSEAIKTSQHYDDVKLRLANYTLGIAGEGGEVAEIIKKYIRGDGELCVDDLRKELGDILWYMANMCEVLGITLQECAEYNIFKLRNRHGEKFTGRGKRDTYDTK